MKTVGLILGLVGLSGCGGVGRGVARPDVAETENASMPEPRQTAPPEEGARAGEDAADRNNSGPPLATTKAQIRQVIRGHRAQYQACYDTGLIASPDLAGTIRVRFTISGDGSVIASSLIKTTMDAPVVEACVVQAVLDWRFPAPPREGVIIVNYPFMFTPER